MGTWDYQPLENDEAQDLLADFNDSKDISVLEAPLDKVCSLPGGIYLEAPEAQQAVASAKILNDLSESDIKTEDRQRLIEKSVLALKRILSNSELKELWSDSSEYDDWVKSVQELIGE